jgi:hypothetical protein
MTGSGSWILQHRASDGHCGLETHRKITKMRNLFPLPIPSLLASPALAAEVHADHEPPHLTRRPRNEGPKIAIGVSVAAGVTGIAFAIWCCRQKPWVTPDKPRIERAPTMPPSYGFCHEEMRPRVMRRVRPRGGLWGRGRTGGGYRCLRMQCRMWVGRREVGHRMHRVRIREAPRRRPVSATCGCGAGKHGIGGWGRVVPKGRPRQRLLRQQHKGRFE